jgi:hypothetical protein
MSTVQEQGAVLLDMRYEVKVRELATKWEEVGGTEQKKMLGNP